GRTASDGIGGTNVSTSTAMPTPTSPSVSMRLSTHPMKPSYSAAGWTSVASWAVRVRFMAPGLSGWRRGRRRPALRTLPVLGRRDAVVVGRCRRNAVGGREECGEGLGRRLWEGARRPTADVRGGRAADGAAVRVRGYVSEVALDVG